MDLNAAVCLAEYLNCITPTIIVNGRPMTPAAETYRPRLMTPLEKEAKRRIYIR